jgi:hypothetical protein
MRPKTEPLETTPEEVYPSCETTLWQIGQWRCVYWRAEGMWSGGSLRLFRGAQLARSVEFGLRAREQSSAWRVAVRENPNATPESGDPGDRPVRNR